MIGSNTGPAAMLSVQDIHTYYRDSYILQGVTLDLKAGQVVGLLGRNGVGKTTLARSILGLTPARRGRFCSWIATSRDCRHTRLLAWASVMCRKEDVCFAH